MKLLYAPWRSEYHNKAVHDNKTDQDSCVFCTQIGAQEDERYLILKRGTHHVIMLNKYPYNAGHLLIIPYGHIAELQALTDESRHELMDLMNLCIIALQQAMNPQGFNTGMNLGKAAGAGIPAHLHMHVLPRYNGDTNFLPLLAETKQISTDLRQMFASLKQYFL